MPPKTKKNVGSKKATTLNSEGISRSDTSEYKGQSAGKPLKERWSVRQEEVFWRRRFIWETVSREGYLSYSELKRGVQSWRREKERPVGDLAPQAIADDIKFWNHLGIRLVAVVPKGEHVDKRERWIIDEAAAHISSKDPRANLNLTEKQAIADFAMGMICGFGFDSPDGAHTTSPVSKPQKFEHCYNWLDIRAELVRKRPSRAEAVCHHILGRLLAMYAEENRGLAFDAGTTNDKIIDYISELELPTEFSKLAHLTVCTNSRGMFQKLGEPKVGAKVIVIGGEQRWRTEVVAGSLAELFIRAAGLLHFSVSFVGATILDLTHMHVCSDSQEEARLKSLLFERSSLRIVNADWSKWQPYPMRITFPFARLNPQQFDAIITSEPAQPENDPKGESSEYKRKLAEFNENVPRIEEQGIPVFRTKPRSQRTK